MKLHTVLVNSDTSHLRCRSGPPTLRKNSTWTEAGLDIAAHAWQFRLHWKSLQGKTFPSESLLWLTYLLHVFPIHFQWDPLRFSCDGCQCVRQRLHHRLNGAWSRACITHHAAAVYHASWRSVTNATQQTTALNCTQPLCWRSVTLIMWEISST